jgi:hypothetical protein
MDLKPYRAKRSRMSTLEELRKQDRFSDFLHVAWGIIELRVDESILKAYGLSSHDVRAQPLLALSVAKKLELFKYMKCLSSKDYDMVNDFRKKRNELFHMWGLSIPNLTKEEKEEIMDKGLRAVDIMNNLSEFLGQPQSIKRFYESPKRKDQF